MSEAAPEVADVLKGGYSSPGENLEDLNKQYAPVSQQKRVPYWIRKGEMFGYIFRGWTMVDYLRNTSTPAPHEKREFKLGRKEGFENIITWGRQGTRKSNLNRQMMYAVLGDWDTVLQYFLMTKQQIYDVYHMTTDEQVKVPYVTLDDITTTIPKQLFFVGMQEFIRFQQFIATIRLRIGIVGSNSPLPQNVISVLKDNISMEIVCFPNTTYMVERYCWFPHEFLPVTAYLRKVMIEYKSWNYLAEPEWVYNKYKEKRWVITEEIVRKLQGDDAEPEYVIPQVDMQEFEKRVRICKVCKCFSSREGTCVCANHLHDAVQISNAKLRDIVDITLKTLQEKATTVSASNPSDAEKVFG